MYIAWKMFLIIFKISSVRQHMIKCQKYLREFLRRGKSHLAVVVKGRCNVASGFI